MSLLPEIERELLRVARLALPDDPAEASPGVRRSGRRASRPDRPAVSSVAAVAVVLAALAIGALFVSELHTGGAVRSGGRRPTSPPAATSDCYAHNKLTRHYSVAQLRRALTTMPADVKEYTDCYQMIENQLLRQLGTSIPGAPRAQRDWDGVASWTCPLAAPNRYLPPQSGCVTVGLADLTGNGHADLILVYSRLSGSGVRRSGSSAGSRKLYQATAAFLKAVFPDGHSVTARLPGIRAAALVGLGDVNRDRGEELLIEVSHISSGSTAVAYGFHDGRLIPAGVTLAYGGDSATKAGFDCLAGPSPRLVQRTFELDGPTIYAWWTETELTYAWHGPRLVRIARRSFRRRGLPSVAETSIGAGCVTGRAVTVMHATQAGFAQPGG